MILLKPRSASIKPAAAWLKAISPSLKFKTLRSLGQDPKYINQCFRLIDNNAEKINLRPKTRVQVIKAFDGNLYAICREKVLSMDRVNYCKPVSFNFDNAVEMREKRVVYIPPMQHPWKMGTFDTFWKQQWDRKYSFDDLCYSQENIYNKV